MSNTQLGDLVFRLDPDQIKYAYEINYAAIDTLGGQVIQVLGATIGDITITGSFGQDHPNKQLSWEMAEAFHAKIKQMMDAQTLPGQGQGKGVTHQPIRFSFMDGIHDWNFKVLIKAISDPDGGSITHSNGKFAYQYTLTLFLVEDSTLALKRIATDQFISRISTGLGWKASRFNGSMSREAAIEFIRNHSSDGTYIGMVEDLLQQAKDGPATSVIPRTR